MRDSVVSGSLFFRLHNNLNMNKVLIVDASYSDRRLMSGRRLNDPTSEKQKIISSL